MCLNSFSLLMTPPFFTRILTLRIKSNRINEELKEVSNWSKATKLSVNPSKTNYMILGTSCKCDFRQYCIGKSKSKFLGVLIDDCLTWKNHIDCVSKTISRNIGVMNKLKGCRMGRSDKVSLWYVALLINTRFRFFIFRISNCLAHLMLH